MVTLRPFLRMASALALAFFVFGTNNAQAQSRNMGTSLKELVKMYKESRKAARQAEPNFKNKFFGYDLGARQFGLTPSADPNIFADDENRVLMVVHLDGKAPLGKLRKAAEKLGINVVAENSAFRKGIISAYVPAGIADDLAAMPGVESVALAFRPVLNVGATTSQASVVHRTNLANALGYDGTGITVGVMSDSFNRANTPIKAANDVATGDLPNNTSIPGGEGLKFLIEGLGFANPSDEGRGMAQLVFDLAPGSELCFATAFVGGQVGFANNIRALRTDPACNADVIVDDVFYFAEPFFSDGIVAQAADEVVTSDALPGKKVAYFSSAGNQRRNGYASPLRFVSDATGRAQPGINWGTLPATFNTAGGFQDFDPGPGIRVAQNVLLSGNSRTFSFQWDDPYHSAGGTTTDLDIHIFFNGNYLFSFATDNFANNEPIEVGGINGGNGATIQVVVARRGGGAQQATKLKYFSSGAITADFADRNTALTFGHNSARNAIGVGAYVYDGQPLAPGFVPEIESFSSPGVVEINFDASGNRLPVPEIRKKPDIAAVDGTNTTFFPIGALANTDYEGDGFPNFFGTSAAAPHAAGVAALMLQAAGGPNSLTAQQIQSIMQNTAPPHDLDVYNIRALGSSANGSITVQCLGDSSNADGQNSNGCRINFSSPIAGVTLNSLNLDIAPAGLNFDPRTIASGGFPLTAGSNTSPGVTITNLPFPTARVTNITMNFAGFSSGRFLSFNVDRDYASSNGGGNNVDLMQSSTFSGTLSNGAVINGMFNNRMGKGFTVNDGYGLIDAVNAINAIP